MPDKLHICLATDERWVRSAQRAIYDIIIRKNPETQIKFYVLMESVNASSSFDAFKTIPNIEVVTLTIHAEDEFGEIKPYFWDWLGPFKHLKFLIPDLNLFNGVNKVLYLDTDMLARKDLSDVYNIDLDTYAIAGVRDYLHLRVPFYMDAFRNCNKVENGLLLMNLPKLRRLQFTDRCKAANQIYVGDLGILESVAFPYTKLLDPKYQIPFHHIASEACYQDIDRWNEYTGSEYTDIFDLVNQSYLWHFTGDKEKEYNDIPILKTITDTSEERLDAFLETEEVMNWTPADDNFTFTLINNEESEQ